MNPRSKAAFTLLLGISLVLGGCSSSAEVETGKTTEVAAASAENNTHIESPTVEEATNDQGTRVNPYPLGFTVSDDEWAVTINSVNLDATAEIAAANMFNEPAPEGKVFILVNATAQYMGQNPDGDSAWVTVDYVTADGVTISSTDTFAVAPDAFPDFTTLYEGGSITGNIALAVPAATAGEGTLIVQPAMLSDKFFFAVQ